MYQQYTVWWLITMFMVPGTKWDLYAKSNEYDIVIYLKAMGPCLYDIFMVYDTNEIILVKLSLKIYSQTWILSCVHGESANKYVWVHMWNTTQKKTDAYHDLIVFIMSYYISLCHHFDHITIIMTFCYHLYNRMQ